MIRWLHALDPERNVSGELLRASVRYSTTLAASSKSPPGMPRETSSLFIPMYLRNTYVLGELCGPMSLNILVLALVCAPTPPPMPRNRRFVVDLATTNPVEFVEYEWMQDGRLCVSLHEVTEAGMYSGQTIIFDGPPGADSPVPSRVAMRLHYRELPVPGKEKARLPQGWRESPSSWESWVETFSKLRTGLSKMCIRYAISPPSPNSPQLRGEITTLFEEECAIGEATIANKLVRMFLQMRGITVGNSTGNSEFLRSAQREISAGQVNGMYDEENPIYDDVHEAGGNVAVEPNGTAEPMFTTVPLQTQEEPGIGMDNHLQTTHQEPDAAQGPHENGNNPVPTQQAPGEGGADEQPYTLSQSQPASSDFISPAYSLPPPPPEFHPPETDYPTNRTLSTYSIPNSSLNGSQNHSLPPPGFPMGGSTTQIEGSTGTLPQILVPEEVNQPLRETPTLSDPGRAIPTQSVSGTESIGSSRLQQPEPNRVPESPGLAQIPSMTIPMSPNTGNTQSTGTDVNVSKPMPSISAPIPISSISSRTTFETTLIPQKTVFPHQPGSPVPKPIVPQPVSKGLQSSLSERQLPPLPIVTTHLVPPPPVAHPPSPPPSQQQEQLPPPPPPPPPLPPHQQLHPQTPQPPQPPQQPTIRKAPTMSQPGPPLLPMSTQQEVNKQLPSIEERVPETPKHDVAPLGANQGPSKSYKDTGASNGIRLPSPVPVSTPASVRVPTPPRAAAPAAAPAAPAALPVAGGITKPQTKSGKREHVCECGRLFAHRGHFNAHRKAVHEKIRAHKCTYKDCDRAFAKRGDLLRHQMSQHAEDVRYPCSQCNVSFPDKAALAKHFLEVHDQDRPFKCPHCTKSYSSRSGLRKHIQRKHEKGTVPQQQQIAEAPVVM